MPRKQAPATREGAKPPLPVFFKVIGSIFSTHHLPSTEARGTENRDVASDIHSVHHVVHREVQLLLVARLAQRLAEVVST